MTGKLVLVIGQGPVSLEVGLSIRHPECSEDVAAGFLQSEQYKRPMLKWTCALVLIVIFSQAALIQCGNGFDKGSNTRRYRSLVGTLDAGDHQYSSSLQAKPSALQHKQEDIAIHEISAYSSEAVCKWTHFREFCSNRIDNTQTPLNIFWASLNIQKPLNSTTHR